MVGVVQFDEASHTYTVDGQVWPGVTSILRPIMNFTGIPQAVLDAKADLGRRVHFACQLNDENDLDEESVEDDVRPYLVAYRRFLADTGATVLENERVVHHPTFRYCGTLDRVFRLGHRRAMVDLKTCFSTPISAGPQTAAYVQALKALGSDPADERAALRLRPDGTYRYEVLSAPSDWSVFLACLTLHYFLKDNEQ